MKKFLVILSLFCFVALVSNAQTATTAATDEVKTEASAVKSSDENVSSKSCCKVVNKSCCMNNKGAKGCTAEQKAACAKDGHKSKAEAKATEAVAAEEAKAKGTN